MGQNCQNLQKTCAAAFLDISGEKYCMHYISSEAMPSSQPGALWVISWQFFLGKKGVFYPLNNLFMLQLHKLYHWDPTNYAHFFSYCTSDVTWVTDKDPYPWTGIHVPNPPMNLPLVPCARDMDPCVCGPIHGSMWCKASSGLSLVLCDTGFTWVLHRYPQEPCLVGPI